MKQEKERSEGEEIIGEFLKEENVDFIPEKKIENLKEDVTSYIVADFYLPKYKVYIEFFGKWNSEIHKRGYREKKETYKKNKIPCIYLYPDNLGILKQIFYIRLKKVLLENNNKLGLFKLNWEIFQEKYLMSTIILLILSYYIPNLIGKVFVILLLGYNIYEGMKNTFLKRANYLNRNTPYSS